MKSNLILNDILQLWVIGHQSFLIIRLKKFLVIRKALL